MQFISSEGATTQYSDSIEVLTDQSTPPTTTVPDVTIARNFSASQPVVVATSSAPVRSATVMPRQKQSNIVRIQTKIGKKISTRTVVASRVGKYVIVFPKGITSMNVRFISRSGSVSAWSRIAAP